MQFSKNVIISSFVYFSGGATITQGHLQRSSCGVKYVASQKFGAQSQIDLESNDVMGWNALFHYS